MIQYLNSDLYDDEYEEYSHDQLVQKSIILLYSYFYGMMPKKYSREFLFCMSESEQNVEKQINTRAKDESDLLDDLVFKNDDSLIPNSLKHRVQRIKNDSARKEIVEYIKEQKVNCAFKTFKKNYLRLNSFYKDIMVPLNNKLNKECSVSVDLLALKVDYALKYDFEDYYDYVYANDPKALMEVKQNTLYGVRDVYDPKTQKTYKVAMEIDAPEGIDESTPQGKMDLDNYIMNCVMANDGFAIILGESGGQVNPFSFLPINFKGDILVSNLNILPKDVGPTFFAMKAYGYFQSDIIANNNFESYYNLHNAMKIEQKGYNHIVDAIYQTAGVDILDDDIVAIQKISRPNLFKRMFTNKETRMENLKNYINSKRKTNSEVIASAQKVADEFDQRAISTKNEVESPFPEFE